MELDYVAAGTVQFQTPEEIRELPTGSMVFINTEAMHDIRAKNCQKGCEIYAHIFQSRFLAGTYNSLFDQKYMLPITGKIGKAFYASMGCTPRAYRQEKAQIHTAADAERPEKARNISKIFSFS